MRILWITRAYPFPAFAGDLLYSGRMLRAISAAGGKLDVVTRAAGDLENESADGRITVVLRNGVEWTLLPESKRGRFLSLFSILPSDPYRLASADAIGAVRELTRKNDYDWVVIDIGAMGWALRPLKTALKRGTKLLYLSHNHEKHTRMMVALGMRNPVMRMALLYDAFKYGLMEDRIVRAASLVCTITREDGEAYAADKVQARILLAPPGYDGIRLLGREIDETTPRRIVILGHFNWVAKQENLLRFVQAAMPVLEAAGVGISIIGHVGQKLITKIQSFNQDIEFLGRADDLHSALRQAGRIGVVAENLGGGFKMKTLDYVFNGLPLAGLEVALTGMPLTSGVGMIGAGDFEDLANKVVQVVDDFPLLNKMRHIAFEQAKTEFDWSISGRNILSEMASVC